MIDLRHFCTVISPKDRFNIIFEMVSPLHVYFVYQRAEFVYSFNHKMLSSVHISLPPLNNHICGIPINSV